MNTQTNSNGLLQFSKQLLTTKFSDLFETKVGAVPRSKKLATNDDAALTEAFVHSGTVKDHSLVYYDLNAEWIRPWNGDKAQIFCNCKTREKLAFFTLDEPTAWDGSVIALYPTELAKTRFHIRKDVVNYLNGLDWFDLGCEDGSGRKHFSVGVFDRMMLP